MVDDGSCIVGGCTDPMNSAYDSEATYDDGSCVVVITGCMDSAAANFRVLATVEDGSCVYAGCIDPRGENYNPSATLPVTCIFLLQGCTDSVASNFASAANTDGTESHEKPRVWEA